MREISQPSPQAPRRAPRGPVVIWNLVRRCNLTCKHCYSFSADTDYAGELSTDEVFSVMEDLKAFGVPALILSGGEPLLRPDLFDIARQARQHRFYVGLSTNGTLLDQALVEQVANSGFDYVGISIDGRRETHDRFRRLQGAFDRSVAAIRMCHSAGIKIGLRFTMTEDNAADLPWMLNFIETEQIDKFYFSHLNYAGRGNIHRGRDAFFETTRRAMDLLFDTCWRWQRQGMPREVVTGNNDADGVYFLHWVSARFPEARIRIRRALAQWGGNASGVHIANIDNIGNVHPDTMWWDYTLGNIRERPFSDIWRDTSDPLMAGLKQNPRPLKGRCAACAHLDICGGNTRVRARQITGDPWEEDPACYLTNPEIGIPEQPRRAAHRLHMLRRIAT
jgi:heme d1 biosynthesis radical SAM protein NirJ